MDKLARGTQIVYNTHGAKEYGFVTSGPTASGGYFCRFWHEGGTYLSTIANSVLVNPDSLTVENTVPQSRVDETLAALYD